MAVRKPGAKTPSKSAAASTRTGRERQNLLVNRETLRRAMAALGSTNMSETVNVALDRLAEDAAILRGLDAASGAIPDFPDPDA